MGGLLWLDPVGYNAAIIYIQISRQEVRVVAGQTNARGGVDSLSRAGTSAIRAGIRPARQGVHTLPVTSLSPPTPETKVPWM